MDLNVRQKNQTWGKAMLHADRGLPLKKRNGISLIPVTVSQ
jgi:hypothetical protein